MNEAYTYLTEMMNAQVETLSYMMYADFAQRPQHALLSRSVRGCLLHFMQACTLKEHMRACVDAMQPRSAFRREFVELFGPTIERSVDVVLCQFPGFQCALFSELRVGLALRFTHRFDHHIWYGGMGAKARWDRMVVDWHTHMAHGAIFADNPYDAEYLWHFLRVPAIPWPAVGLRLILGSARSAQRGSHEQSFKRLTQAVKKLHQRGRLDKHKAQWCWCCLARRPEYPKTNELMAHLQSYVPEHRIRTMREARVNPNAESLAQTSSCTAFILIPHSLHSYTSVEVYAVGYPIVAPSASLLAEWHARYDVIQHRAPGNKPWMPSLQAPSDSPLSAHTADIARWLTHVDFLRWPHVRILHSNRELRQVMQETHHALRPEQSQYMQMASFEALPRVESTLRDIANNAHKGRSFARDGRAPAWNGTRALVQLAAWCQKGGAALRVRSQFRDEYAESGWAAAQQGADVNALCVVRRANRRPPPSARAEQRPRAVEVHGKLEGVGFCDVTVAGEGAACASSDTKGSWVTDELTACYMRCAGCAACSFISFNKDDRDCSWFSTCTKPLMTSANVSGYVAARPHVTYRVRAADGTLHNDSSVGPALPPLPPPPPPPLPRSNHDWCKSPLTAPSARW